MVSGPTLDCASSSAAPGWVASSAEKAVDSRLAGGLALTTSSAPRRPTLVSAGPKGAPLAAKIRPGSISSSA